MRMHPGLGHDRDQPARARSPTRPRERDPTEDLDWRAKTGRVVAGVELRIVADGDTVAALGRQERSVRSRCADRGSPAPTTRPGRRQVR